MLASTLLCLVISVADGDTLTVRCGNHRPLRVRIVSIDAPEKRQAFGKQSGAHLKALCHRRQASLRTVGKDGYGRTLAHVRCAGQDTAAYQVRAGLAWVYTPQAKRYPELVQLQKRAQASHTGLWSQKRPLAPWDYRKRQRKR